MYHQVCCILKRGESVYNDQGWYKIGNFLLTKGAIKSFKVTTIDIGLAALTVKHA